MSIRVGFWRATQDEKSNLPYPEVSKRFLFPEDRITILRPIINFLKRGRAIAYYKGSATCKLCGMEIGSTDWKCAHFVYPQGYVHYLERHWVEPDPRLEAYIKNITRDVAWFDSLTKQDFQNGAVLDEIRKAFKELEQLRKK